METGERLCEAVRKGKTVRKKKKNMMRRGTVGFLLKMEFDYSNVKEEEEEEEDVLNKSERSSAESEEPSSQPRPSLISNITTEAEVERPLESLTEEPKSEEVLPSMPVFDI